jgi:pyruvate kinase
MRRSKIVCTLGPAVDSHEQLVALIEAGMNVARFNFSHGTHEEHQGRYDRVRAAAKETGRAIGVLADLQGPKIRLATFAEGPVELVRGDEFTITTDDVPGDKTICGTTYKGLTGDVAKGDQILINDGNVELKVTEVSGSRVRTIVIEGGVISDHKGINLPGAAVNVPALSEKDVEDLRFALRMGCDLVALSFVRDANDVHDVRKIMEEEGRRVPVIAKVEKPQAVANMEDVVMAFDGVMVARGDLAVEYPLEKVPMVQKRLIELCRRNAKPVIVATQMMESMITNPRRGLRRGQRDPGRRRRGHAVRRVERGRVPDRDRQDDVEDRPGGRGGAAGQGPAAAGPGQEAAYAGRFGGPCRLRDRRLPRRQGPGGLHQVR